MSDQGDDGWMAGPAFHEFLRQAGLRGFVTYSAIDAALPKGIVSGAMIDAVLARLAEAGVRVIEDPQTGSMPQRKADVSRTDYFYVLHRNADGVETTARIYRSREFALLALAAEAGEGLGFVEDGRRSGSHTLKRLANSAGRPGDVLETFLVRSTPTT